MIPSSWTWQTISLASYQIFRLPGDLACLTVLAATSLTASVRSIARASVSPAWIAYRCTTARIAARSVVYEYDMGIIRGGRRRHESVAVRPGNRLTGGRLSSRRFALCGLAFPGHQQTQYTGPGNGPPGCAVWPRMPNPACTGRRVQVYPPRTG